MAVVLLDLTRVGVPERLRHHEQRGAVHDGVTGERMPGGMEINRRTDAGALRSFLHQSLLLRLPPRPAIGAGENQIATVAPSTGRLKELPRLIGHVHVVDSLAAVALS